MSAPADLAADEEARVRAVDPSRSVILQAPAGSGKTTVLVERLLRLLIEADAPEDILAITFTRKAAAEMALRVASVLDLPPDPQGDGRTRELARLAQAVRGRSQARGWQLAENPGRLRIQTVDALNRALALQLPVAAHGAGTLAVLRDAESAYRTAARRTLLDAQGDAARRADVEFLFERMENDFALCEELIADMLERRTHWLPHLVGEAGAQLAQRVQASLSAVVQARLDRARQVLTAAQLREGLRIGAEVAAHLRSGVDFAHSADSPTLRQWQALASLALTRQGEWRRRLDVRAGFPPEDKALKRRAGDWLADLGTQPGSLELFIEMRLLPEPQLGDDEIQALGVLARVLELAVAELDVVFTELGRVDYAAVAVAARMALGSMDEPTDLALRLDHGIRHILVDEFQDTSLEQTRLLAQLTAGWEPGDGRTLFLVGDPMQSIYAFREAEVGMFLGARTAGIGTVPLEALTLRRNFRSAAQVVDWNNAVFARCFPALDDPRTSSVAYEHSVAARPGLEGAVHLHRVLPGDYPGEARGIARIVGQLRRDEPQASVAILVSSRAHAGPIVAALEAARIPVAGVELVPLGELSIVRDLAALTQALDHFGHRTAWLALLRAPWCGLTLRQITGLVGTDRRATVWERLCDPLAQATLEAPARERVRRLHEALATSLAEGAQTYPTGREALARRVESAWLRLGGPAACAQEADLAHARAFFDALAQWSGEPEWAGPQDLPQRLTRLFAVHQAAGVNAVQIMTIHRAKGLEFDHVILPGLGRQRRAGRPPLLQWLDLPRGTRGSDLLMVAVRPAAAREPTPLARYVTHLQEQRARQEDTRLLYVAATRAKRQLHLFGQLPDPVAGKPEPAPRSGTLLERLWPAISARFPARAQFAEDTAVPLPAAPARAAASLQRLAPGWHLPQLPGGPRPEALAIASYEVVPETALPADLPEQAVCEVLRSFARRRRLPRPDEGTQAEALTARLQRLGCRPEALPRSVAGGLELLRDCLEDPPLRWIFERLAAADAEAEVPLSLTGMFAGRLTSIRADLSFRDAAGTRWLIDIAPQPAPPESLEAAFGSRLARHAHLAKLLAEGPVRVAVYLPAGRRLWWP